MFEKVIKPKSYENIWSSTGFKITRLSCQPKDVRALIDLLRATYAEYGFYIIDSYVVKGNIICKVELLLKLMKSGGSLNGNLIKMEEPQCVTDKLVEGYYSQKMVLDEEDEPEDGVYVIPGEYRTKVRALYDYLKERGISIEELTPEELQKFIVKR